MAMMETRRQSQIPPGFRFKPTDVELVNLLRRKVKRDETYSFITDMDVYEKEPWLLQHVTPSENNVWYYFVTRKKPKKASSRKTSRTVGDFTWKSNSLTDIVDQNRVKVGVMQSLTFLSKNRAEKATGWVMHEYLLDEADFEEVVLCRIKFRPCVDNAQYAPRSESLMNRAQPKPRDGLVLVENKDPRHHVEAADKETVYLDAQVETKQDMLQLVLDAQRQHIMGQDSNYLMNRAMEEHQEFGSCDQLVGESMARAWWNQTYPSHVPMMNHHHNVKESEGVGEDMVPTQPPMDIQGFETCGQNNDLLVVPMETEQEQDTVVENSAAQSQLVEKDNNVPLIAKEKVDDEQDMDIDSDKGLSTMNQAADLVTKQSIDGDIDDDFIATLDMSNFGDEEWVKSLGVVTPEEEAEFNASLSNCKTVTDLINYLCPM